MTTKEKAAPYLAEIKAIGAELEPKVGYAPTPVKDFIRRSMAVGERAGKEAGAEVGVLVGRMVGVAEEYFHRLETGTLRLREFAESVAKGVRGVADARDEMDKVAAWGHEFHPELGAELGVRAAGMLRPKFQMGARVVLKDGRTGTISPFTPRPVPEGWRELNAKTVVGGVILSSGEWWYLVRGDGWSEKKPEESLRAL